ncbi:hypothetical protein AgCh_027235 [Apium graveolens]
MRVEDALLQLQVTIKRASRTVYQVTRLLVLLLIIVKWVNVWDFGGVAVRKCRGHMGLDCHEKVNFGFRVSVNSTRVAGGMAPVPAHSTVPEPQSAVAQLNLHVASSVHRVGPLILPD